MNGRRHAAASIALQPRYEFPAIDAEAPAGSLGDDRVEDR